MKPLYTWWVCKLVQLLWKTVWRFFKIKTELLFNLEILHLGIYPKKMKTPTQKHICTSTFIAALLTVTMIWKQPVCPLIDEWVSGKCYICSMEYYSAIKRWNLDICNNMNGPWGHHTKWYKSDRENQILYDLCDIWKLKISIKTAVLQYKICKFRSISCLLLCLDSCYSKNNFILPVFGILTIFS